MATTAAPRTRAEIAAEIAAKRAQAKRMPAHWEARRLAVARDVDRLVDEWLEAGE